MMKKPVIMAVVLLLSGCMNQAKSDDMINSSNTAMDTNNPPAANNSPINMKKEGNCKLQIDQDFVQIASEGKLKGIEIELGIPRAKIIEKLGQPEMIGMRNAEYLNYSNCYFYIGDGERVGVIDVEIDLSVKKVKELLGKPHYEGWSEAGYKEYVLGYEAKEYYLYFKFANEMSTSGVLRFKNPRGS